MVAKLNAIAVSACVVLLLAGCAPAAPASKPPTGSVPTVEAIVPEADTEELNADGTPYEAPELLAGEESYATAKGIVPFGTTYVWGGGVKMNISAPQPFEPTANASVTPQARNVYVTVTITNGSDTVLDPAASIVGSSGGVEVAEIFDYGHPMGDIGASPSAAILPGGAITWISAFAITDLDSLLLQSAPTWDYEATIWTDQS